MSKQPRKSKEQNSFEREEKARHYFKVQKRQESNKMMKNLDRALRNKDFTRLATEEF